MNLKKSESKSEVDVSFDDAQITIESLENLSLDGVKEFSFYLEDGLAVYANDKAYVKKNPTTEDFQKVFDNAILKIRDLTGVS